MTLSLFAANNKYLLQIAYLSSELLKWRFQFITLQTFPTRSRIRHVHGKYAKFIEAQCPSRFSINQIWEREGDWWEQPTFLCTAFTECEKGFQQDRESSCCHDSTGKPRDWKGLHQLTAAILCQRNCAACLHTDNSARGMPACQISLVLLCKIPRSCPLNLEYSRNLAKMETVLPASCPFNTPHTFCSSIWFIRGSA